MSADAYRLGIDFGTSSTVAVLSGPGVRAEPVLFDGSPLLPSAVCAGADGTLLTGRDALQAALGAPERFEPHPKRRIGEGSVLLGAEFAVSDLIAAVLTRVLTEARRIIGGPPGAIVVTHPASWGAPSREVLSAALATAGMPAAEPVVEPVAAAAYLAGAVPAAGPILVYDLGAGTFDATLVEPGPDGLQVLATAGREVGGLDIDAAIVAAVANPRDERWQRLRAPVSAAERRAARQLWDNVRTAKEALARLPSALIHVPVLELEVPLGREQLDQLAGPVIARSLDAVQEVLDARRVRAGELAAVLLVGGGSRMPLVATALRRRFGVDPLVVEQPELLVAKGAAARDPAASPETAGHAFEPVTAPPETGAAGREPAAALLETSEHPPRSLAAPAETGTAARETGTTAHEPGTTAQEPGTAPSGRGAMAGIAALVALAALLVVVAVAIRNGRDTDTPAATGPGATTSPSPSPTPVKTRPPTFTVAVAALGTTDFTLDGSMRNGYCTPFDSADGHRYAIEGAEPGVEFRPGVAGMRITGYAEPDATGCNGRTKLWVTTAAPVPAATG